MRTALSILCLVITSSLSAADLTATARATAEKHGKAVVSIRAVVLMKQSLGGQTQDQEGKVEIAGMVVDPNGLTVTASSLLDPSAILQQMFASMGGGADAMKIEADVKEAALILPDGTEVPAEVVMKDTELDLAFLRPKDATKQFEAVALKPRATVPQMLDPVFVVGRLGKLGNRSLTLTTGAVRAVVKGPRTFFVCDNEISTNVGAIVYTADAEPLGLLVTRVSSEGAAGTMGMLAMLTGGGARETIMPIVRSIEDVIEIAAQAKNAKPAPPKVAEEKKETKPETKPEEKKEEKK